MLAKAMFSSICKLEQGFRQIHWQRLLKSADILRADARG